MQFWVVQCFATLLAAGMTSAQVMLNRTYPLPPSQDTYVDEPSRGTDRYRVDFVEVGRGYDSQPSRTLLQFDLADLAQRSRWGRTERLPDVNRTAVLGATLRLSCVSILDWSAAGSAAVFRGTVHASQVLRPWDPVGVTWLERDTSGGVWATGGLGVGGTDAAQPFAQSEVRLDYNACHGEAAALSLDIPPGLLRAWLQEPAAFHGILLWASLPADAKTMLRLASIENGLVGKHPELVVTLQDTIIDSGVTCPSAEFQCVDGSCISWTKVCNFIPDCLHGNDEDSCDARCDFQEQCSWEAPTVGQMPGWQVHSGATETPNTGPSGGQSDTGSDVASRYLYVDATGGTAGRRSHLVSPPYSESGPRCALHFFYHMYGGDVGTLRVILTLSQNNWTLWERTGSQSNQWMGEVLSLGRLEKPFRIIFEAEQGDSLGDAGDVALDSLELMQCSPDLAAVFCPAPFYQCQNLACITPDDLCNLQADCLFGEDEAEEKCGVIPPGGTCSFESGWCGWHNVLEGDTFNWTRHNGSTQTSSTGPSTDHTLASPQGFYVYTEVSKISPGSKAFLRSVWFPPPPPATYDEGSPHHGTCKVQFFYHMYGDHIGQLQLFAIHNSTTESSNQLFSESAEDMDLWQGVLVSLPAITDSYYLQFEGTRGLSYKGDMALDDISLSRQCFQLEDQMQTEITTLPITATKTMQATQATMTEQAYSTLAAGETAVFHFGTCGSKGREGPGQLECNVAYRLENISVTVTGGIQQWRVPVTRTYRLKVVGAGGGTGVENTRPSRGAEMQASFSLTEGDQLVILVGQRGQDACQDDDESPNFGPGGFCSRQLTETEKDQFDVGGVYAGGGGGGGGGTFVAMVDASSGDLTPLLVAGGGGGQSFSPGPTLEGVHGSVEAPGPGLPGQHGSSEDGSGAGGGWNGSQPSVNPVGGTSFLQGGLGGMECYQARRENNWRTLGGFGGGGGACTSGGGGGGYTGGDAPLVKDLFGSGRGGSSFVHPSGFNVRKEAGANLGAGEVIITAVTVCQNGGQLDEDKNICIGPSPRSLPVDIIASAISAFLIMLCIVVVIVVVYRRKRAREAKARQDNADYQLNQLRNNATMNFNPCYHLGNGAATASDLKEVPRENLKLLKCLGQGAFGEVYQGLLQHTDSKEGTEVAVKTLPKRSTEQDESDFLMEALIMGNFDHPNIVSLRGVCFGQSPRFILLEFMAGGELRQFLRDSRPKRGCPSPLDMSDLLSIAHDVTKGCHYLESRRFIHRDIAARNILLSCCEPGRVAKIGDFGMARDIYSAEYYKKGGQAMLPIKWMPPEAFLDGIFTSKTDVWSYGVLLWEIMSLGYMPYPGMTNQEVIFFMTQGQRMNPPRNCPKPIQDLMLQCWQQEPEDRPTFATIMQFIGDCLQNPSILSAPLPHEMLDEGGAPVVTRPRNPKTSPILRVPGTRSPGSRAPSSGQLGPASWEEEEDEAYLTPDWVPGGRMKAHLLTEDGNVNNSSSDCRGAWGGEAPSPPQPRRRGREEGGGSSPPRPASDTSFHPAINQDDVATESTDFLDRGWTDGPDAPPPEGMPTLLMSPRTGDRLGADDEAPPGRAPPSPLDDCCDRRRASRTEESAPAAGGVAALSGSGEPTTAAAAAATTPSSPPAPFSLRNLNHIRLPAFTRHRSFEGPASQGAADGATSSGSSPQLPMLNRMHSLPVSPNHYTLTDLTPQQGSPGVFPGPSGADSEASARRVMYNSQSGQVVFEDTEPNAALV